MQLRDIAAQNYQASCIQRNGRINHLLHGRKAKGAGVFVSIVATVIPVTLNSERRIIF
jgi:hypothetical protein